MSSKCVGVAPYSINLQHSFFLRTDQLNEFYQKARWQAAPWKHKSSRRSGSVCWSRCKRLFIFPVFAGMTNRPDLIDDALMRPGRFEVKMEIGTCSSFFSFKDITKTCYLPFTNGAALKKKKRIQLTIESWFVVWYVLSLVMGNSRTGKETVLYICEQHVWDTHHPH